MQFYRYYSGKSIGVNRKEDGVKNRQSPFPVPDKDEVCSSNLRAPTRKALRDNELRKAFLIFCQLCRSVFFATPRRLTSNAALTFSTAALTAP